MKRAAEEINNVNLIVFLILLEGTKRTDIFFKLGISKGNILNISKEVVQ